MADRKRSGSGARGGDPSSTGCLFWLALLCGVILLFLLNLGKIQATLERTDFRDIVKTQREPGGGETLPPVSPSPRAGEDPAPAPAPVPKPEGAKPRDGDVAVTEPGPATAPGDPRATGPRATGPTPAEGQGGTAPAPGAAAGSRPETSAGRTRQSELYFIRIDDDGIIVRQQVKRQIAASDSPLRDALQALLAGPSEEEIRRGLVSLVPQGTVLLSAQVRGSTAWLNFSEAFMYNRYGIEGYAGQLKQVVYTATAFSTVQDVQILVEGERRDYLGGEGVYIGRPLSRNSF